ncbi:hypothetical protein D6_0266 [Aeromonas phage D6]|uniref:Virion structural protein n=1 Tax=Aeromonas phage D6 TaxID=2593322 RepID=A0A514TWM9_9CAUD|nr:hypothetical protein PQC08_gp009 [Aeromonas phage D6]QDJ97425.1 hypothetical protein D6_0266 [Aeromonas phage D6]
MADQTAKFQLERARSFVSGSDLSVTFNIIPATPDEKALLAHVEDLDKVTNTVGSTRTPTSQKFDSAKQTISFIIPVVRSDAKNMTYIFIGDVTIDGVRYPYNYSLTIEPVDVEVNKLFDDGIDMVFEFGYTVHNTKLPVTIPGVVTLNEGSYVKEGAELRKVSETTAAGVALYRVEIELFQVKHPRLFIKGSVAFEYPEYTIHVPFEKWQDENIAWESYPRPLVDYAKKHMWGHRELDNNYQLKLGRVSPANGLINNFFFAGKTFLLPGPSHFYHVFSMGGFDINFWNMGQRKLDWWPFNTWKTLSEISNQRGTSLDVYNGRGRMFPRGDVWMLNTYQGVTFIAMPVTQMYPIPMDKNMYIRCYTSDINTATISEEEQTKYRFGYAFREYSDPADFTYITEQYNMYNSFNTGRVQFFLNGVVSDISKYVRVSGDLLEVAYDPTIGQTHTYKFKDLADFYSVMDEKRKLIIFPGDLSKPRYYKYHNDIDVYVVNRRTKQALYYHRNKVDAIRQLTHHDFALAAGYVEFLISELMNMDSTKRTTVNDIDIQIYHRETKWKFELGPTSSRINDLYLLEDPEKILGAMTGAQSTVKEWSAPELEKGATNFVLNAILQELSTTTVREGLGYNGCSVALSASPLYMPYITPGDPGFEDVFPTPPYETGLGYRIPASYVESSTAYEYDKNGLYIRKVGVIKSEWYKPGPDCYYVEFVVGQASTWLDCAISRTDVKLRPGFGFRVYTAGWLIDPDDPEVPDNSLFKKEFNITADGKEIYPEPYEIKIYGDGENTAPDLEIVTSGGRPDGKWVDVTGTDEYRIVNGYISWNFDTRNKVGMVIFDTVHLFNQFELYHIDNSISFQIMHTWDIGGLPLPIEPGQIDLWINGHPAIENVDYVLDFPNVYVISKMWLKEGGRNTFAYRGRGLSGKGLIPSSELGFVYDGVLGINGRYNLRIDRPTKTIINGRLYLTEALDWSEDINHGQNVGALNGMPYEVKHIYCDNKYVEQFDLHWGFDAARELDQRISDYLTVNADYKQNLPVDYPYLEEDRYRLFSPFMNQLANEMQLGFLTVPAPTETEIGYSDQAIDDITRPYQWLLKYDPSQMDLDLRYFMIHPYSNLQRITVTPNQLTVLSRVNDLYLKGKLRIEGFFEVKHDV